jgi:hypothetical protein
MDCVPPDAVAYWYWGHVHVGAVYVKSGTNPACRCLGHGSIPWSDATDLDNSHVAWYEHRNAEDPDDPQRVLNGFVTLELKGTNIRETFVDENGAVAWSSI